MGANWFITIISITHEKRKKERVGWLAFSSFHCVRRGELLQTDAIFHIQMILCSLPPLCVIVASLHLMWNPVFVIFLLFYTVIPDAGCSIFTSPGVIGIQPFSFCWLGPLWFYVNSIWFRTNLCTTIQNVSRRNPIWMHAAHKNYANRNYAKICWRGHSRLNFTCYSIHNQLRIELRLIYCCATSSWPPIELLKYTSRNQTSRLQQCFWHKRSSEIKASDAGKMSSSGLMCIIQITNSMQICIPSLRACI